MQTVSGQVRAFLALPIPAEVQRKLAEFGREFEAALPPRAVRWVPAGQFHLTLKFFGDIPADAASAIRPALLRAAESVTPFELHTTVPGCFPNSRAPRVLWLGLGGDLAQLNVLQAEVLRQTASWGQSKTREFHPHLTLARTRTTRPAELRAIGAVLTGSEPPPCCR